MNATAHETCNCSLSQTSLNLSGFKLALSWSCRIVAAIILLQTLYFKFTGAPESVFIFTKVHMEPWGRYGSGFAELVAAALLILPRFAWLGAFLAFGIMLGAIASHLTVLGISVMDDGGLLFGLALTVLLSSITTLVLHRSQVPFIPYLSKTKRA